MYNRFAAVGLMLWAKIGPGAKPKGVDYDERCIWGGANEDKRWKGKFFDRLRLVSLPPTNRAAPTMCVT